MTSHTTTEATTDIPQLTFRDWRALLRAAKVLFKVRVVGLLVLSSVAGAFLGARGWPGAIETMILILAGGAAASGASALNEYWERDLDGAMKRTSRRPLVQGQISPRLALVVGIALVAIPIGLTLIFNPPLALFIGLGAFIYVGIYTVWLKPKTVLNIVIGGAAGSAAVMSGGAAVGAWNDTAVIVLALVVFLWTPTHFWSLAIIYKEDYSRAAFPMLPVIATPRQSALWVLLHTTVGSVSALLLVLTPAMSLVYFVPTALAAIYLHYRNYKLMTEPSRKNALAMFMGSNYFLTILFASICLSAVLYGSA